MLRLLFCFGFALADLKTLCNQPQSWQIATGVLSVCSTYDGVEPTTVKNLPAMDTAGELPVYIREVPHDTKISEDLRYDHPVESDSYWADERRRLAIYIRYKGVESVIWKRGRGYVKRMTYEPYEEEVQEEDEAKLDDGGDPDPLNVDDGEDGDPGEEAKDIIDGVEPAESDKGDEEKEAAEEDPADPNPDGKDDDEGKAVQSDDIPEPKEDGETKEDGEETEEKGELEADGGETDGDPDGGEEDGGEDKEDGETDDDDDPEGEDEETEEEDKNADEETEKEDDKEKKKEEEKKKDKRLPSGSDQYGDILLNGASLIDFQRTVRLLVDQSSRSYYGSMKKNRARSLKINDMSPPSLPPDTWAAMYGNYKQEQVCQHTSCAWGQYVDSEGRTLHKTVIFTNKTPYENFHCERVKGTDDCKCMCMSRYQCTLSHHHGDDSPTRKVQTIAHCDPTFV